MSAIRRYGVGEGERKYVVIKGHRLDDSKVRRVLEEMALAETEMFA